MLVQRLWIQRLELLQLMELEPTPLPHTPHGYLDLLIGFGALYVLAMIFVFPTFTRRPFDSMCVFHSTSFSISSFILSAVMTKSSA